MGPGVVRRARRALVVAILTSAAVGACGGVEVFKREYEYEEELYLALDGSATLNVNASVASLVALRGAALDPDPLARVDRAYLRTLFGASAAQVSVSLARRDGRRFVHASITVDDVEELSRIAPFAWSSYRFVRGAETLEFRQRVGPPSDRKPMAAGWTGEEIVAFRMHLPSEVVFHNSPSGQIQRGNILEWEQPLSSRLEGEPVDIHVQLEPTSILANTLLLFGSTVAAAVVALAGVVWWISRRGAAADQ